MGLDRLEFAKLVPLGVSLESALATYGDAIETSADDKVPGATAHVFSAGLYHEVRLVEWHGHIHAATYASDRASRPTSDLKHALDFYGEGVGWHELTPGYSYRRNDLARRLFCSAMPIIAIQTEDYISASTSAKSRSASAQGHDQDEIQTTE